MRLLYPLRNRIEFLREKILADCDQKERPQLEKDLDRCAAGDLGDFEEKYSECECPECGQPIDRATSRRYVCSHWWDKDKKEFWKICKELSETESIQLSVLKKEAV